MDAQQRDEGESRLGQPAMDHNTHTQMTNIQKRFPDFHSPEFVICVSHLMRSQFGHKNFDDMDEDQEVDLREIHTTKFV